MMEQEQTTRKTILILPGGKIENNLLNYLAKTIKECFPYECKIGPNLGQPEWAFDEERNQYLATDILSNLNNI